MLPGGLLLHLQEPTNFPYPEPDQSSSCPPIPLEDRFQYHPPVYT